MAELPAVREVPGDDQRFCFPALIAEWGLAYYQAEIRAARGLAGQLGGSGAPCAT